MRWPLSGLLRPTIRGCALFCARQPLSHRDRAPCYFKSPWRKKNACRNQATGNNLHRWTGSVPPQCLTRLRMPVYHPAYLHGVS